MSCMKKNHKFLDEVKEILDQFDVDILQGN